MPVNDTQIVRMEGIVEEALPGLLFRVNVDGTKVLGHLGGKLKLHHIRVIPGDRVLIESTSYDKTKGRIVRRF